MYDTTKPYKSKILEAIKATWETPYISARSVGGYAVFEKKYQFPEVDHTDGIGTKGIQHWRFRTFTEAVNDAFAMNLNDLTTIGATPTKIQNHIMLPHDDHDAIEKIVKYMATMCKRYNVAMTGGETSIHNNLIGMEISMTMSGFVREIRTNEFRPGDCLIGIPSNGLHSNGFTMAVQWLPDTETTNLTMGTRIYYDIVNDLYKRFEISNAIHIAGGGFTRLRQAGVDVVLSPIEKRLNQPAVFEEIYDLSGKKDQVMFKTFNCGVGFVVSMDKKSAEKLLKSDTLFIDLGAVVAGNGNVVIDSWFSDKRVII